MVRTFPSAPRRPRETWPVILLCLVLAALSTSVVPSVADDLRDKQKKNSRELRKAAGQVDESSAALSTARKRVAVAQEKLGAAQAKLTKTQSELGAAQAQDARMQAALTAANARLAQSRAELKQAKAEVVRQRDQMASLVAQNYQYGDPQLLGLVAMLKSGTPVEVTSQVNTMHNLMNRQASTLDTLKAAEAKAVQLEKQVAERREQVAVRKQQSADLVAVRTRLEQQAEAARGEVAGLVSARRSAQGEAARVLAGDKAILAKLQQEEDRLKRLIMARAVKSGRGFRGDSGSFLMRPVPGAVTSPYGYRKHPIYGYWGLHDGTDFSTPCGQTMRAAAAGTVISSYWSDVYGNRLVIDVGRVNGASLAIVYNHASGYRVGVGDKVGRGEAVGSAGNTGWSTGCHLHFTVLRNGSSTDPMQYL